MAGVFPNFQDAIALCSLVKVADVSHVSNVDCHTDPQNVLCDPDTWHGFVWKLVGDEHFVLQTSSAENR